MTPEKLSKWKKLAEAATDGPWDYNENARDDNVFSGNRRIADVYGARIGGTEQNASNATFIAAARTAVPELIAEVERLQRIIRWSDEVKPCAVCGSKLMWAYAGDATFATECKTGERHKCPMHE